MTDAERIERLEHVVGTLVSWLPGNGSSISQRDAAELLKMLEEPNADDPVE